MRWREATNHDVPSIPRLLNVGADSKGATGHIDVRGVVRMMAVVDPDDVIVLPNG